MPKLAGLASELPKTNPEQNPEFVEIPLSLVELRPEFIEKPGMCRSQSNFGRAQPWLFLISSGCQTEGTIYVKECASAEPQVHGQGGQPKR